MTTMRGTLGIGPSPAPETSLTWDERLAGAICRQTDYTLWHSKEPSERAQAKRLCHTCPIYDLCAQLGEDEEHGIWAGEDKDAARKERERQRKYAQCGTTSGHRSHRVRGEDPCAPCKAAMAAYQAKRDATRIKPACSRDGCGKTVKQHHLCSYHYRETLRLAEAVAS